MKSKNYSSHSTDRNTQLSLFFNGLCWIWVIFFPFSIGFLWSRYRQFSELCSAVSRHLAAVEYDGDKVAEILDQISALKSIMGELYRF